MYSIILMLLPILYLAFVYRFQRLKLTQHRPYFYKSSDKLIAFKISNLEIKSLRLTLMSGR